MMLNKKCYIFENQNSLYSKIKMYLKFGYITFGEATRPNLSLSVWLFSLSDGVFFRLNTYQTILSETILSNI